ncbi:MAG: PTS sugar transporter subunit IIA [Polyangiaceae bacterium]
MNISELLTPDRVAIRNRNAAAELDKPAAIGLLSSLLAQGAHLPEAEVESVLAEREALQSTGIGEGVAIPHGALADLSGPCAALLLVPGGLDFEAIDDAKVTILFAVIGPKRASGEHLKTLAKVSRLLKNASFRDRLLAATSGDAAFDMILAEEAR